MFIIIKLSKDSLLERKTDKLPSTGTDEGQGNNLQQQRRQYNQDRRHQYHQDQTARPARQNQNSAQNHQRPYSSVVGKNDYRSNQSRQYNPPNHRQYTNRYNGGYRQKNQARFETDFDFEKANEQFNGLGEDIDQKLSKIKISGNLHSLKPLDFNTVQRKHSSVIMSFPYVKNLIVDMRKKVQRNNSDARKKREIFTIFLKK